MSGFFYWLTRGHKSRPTSTPSDHWLDKNPPSSHSPAGRPMPHEPLESATFVCAQPLAEAIPGYSADTITNQATAALITTQADADTPGLVQRSSITCLSKECTCAVCREKGIFDPNSHGPWHCPSASCNWKSESTLYYCEMIECAWHAKGHYKRDYQSPFCCPVKDCRFSSKRWSDICRHTTAKHCTNPAKFACSVIECKYHGEGNGFTRKDKLRDHYKKMHQGQKFNGQAARAIKPAPAPSHAKASGSSSSGTQE